MSDTKYCKDCKNMNCPEGRVNCKYPDAIACALYRDTPQTVFQKITASEEVLARSLCGNVRVGCFSGYYSMLTGRHYPDMEEAIAATEARLKEVANAEN